MNDKSLIAGENISYNMDAFHKWNKGMVLYGVIKQI